MVRVTVEPDGKSVGKVFSLNQSKVELGTRRHPFLPFVWSWRHRFSANYVLSGGIFPWVIIPIRVYIVAAARWLAGSYSSGRMA